MKRSFWFLISCAVILLTAACDSLTFMGEGELALRFVDSYYSSTKAVYNLPDTNDFVLEVRSLSNGKLIYSGKYGASPEIIKVQSGKYEVKVFSSYFEGAAFDSPQYGDLQQVTVGNEQKINVDLLCAQINCGIRLRIDQSFLKVYPNGMLFVKSDEARLLYAYREQRIAYFNPGKIYLVLNNGGVEEVLLTRTLASQQILTINLSATGSSATTGADSGTGSAGSDSGSGTDSGSGSGNSGTGSGNSGSGNTGSILQNSGISIQIDTSRVWTTENYKIGGKNTDKGSDDETAYSVASAKNNIGEEDVWVYGYIVGGDLRASEDGISFDTPFTSRTHIAIAARSSVVEKSSCLSVFLPQGDIRDELNLVDNPENLGKQVYLKGDIVEAYYGIPGIKGVSEYKLK